MRKFFVIALSVALIFTLSTTSFGGENIQIPSTMSPGTVIVYDENVQPIILEGGYCSPKEIGKTVQTTPKFIANVPENITQAEKAQLLFENELAMKAEEGFLKGEFISVNNMVAMPGIKVVYDENTGEINNIYYPDKNDPSGYSLHGDGSQL